MPRVRTVAEDASEQKVLDDIAKYGWHGVHILAEGDRGPPKASYYEYVGFARWYYYGNDFPLYQIVRPSRDGHFPWHAMASEEFRRIQPVLGRARLGI